MREDENNSVPVLLYYENGEDRAVDVVFKRDVSLEKLVIRILLMRLTVGTVRTTNIFVSLSGLNYSVNIISITVERVKAGHIML